MGQEPEERFLRETGVGTAFVISGDNAAEVEAATKRFAESAKRMRITLRWDEAELLRVRGRVVLTGIAPNELTRLVPQYRQHGLVRAKVTDWRPELVLDTETGIADGRIRTKPRKSAVQGVR